MRDVDEPRICDLWTCNNRLNKRQPRFCSDAHRETWKQAERKQRRYECRVIATLAPDDKDLIGSVCDRDSFLAALRTVAMRRTDFTVKLSIGHRTVDASARWDVVEAFREDMQRGGHRRNRRPIIPAIDANRDDEHVDDDELDALNIVVTSHDVEFSEPPQGLTQHALESIGK